MLKKEEIEEIVAIAIVVSIFTASLLCLASCMKRTERQQDRCCSCCRRRAEPHEYATLNELLFEVENNETGHLTVPQGDEDNSGCRDVSVESFFPNILKDDKKKRRDNSGLQEPLL